MGGRSRAADEPGGFNRHYKTDHNVWDYLSFVVFIYEQDKDDDDGFDEDKDDDINNLSTCRDRRQRRSQQRRQKKRQKRNENCPKRSAIDPKRRKTL